MQRVKRQESKPPTLDALVGDGRLARLFSSDECHCALQLWILQIRSGESIENRILYGRLIPYNFSNDCWSATEDDDFQSFNQNQAQVVRLNLYIASKHCAELLRQLSGGRTISRISEDLQLGLTDNLKARFGTTALVADVLVYRPVAYLLNRDAHDVRTPTSPHAGAGAFSASITQTDKVALFRLEHGYSVALTGSVVHQLNADTGLDFGDADAARFGDLELLVFPALDDCERSLLSVSWTEAPHALLVRFDPLQVPHFSGFQFRLNIENDHQVAYSSVVTAARDATGIFECKFKLSDQLRIRTDSTEIDIFGYQDAHPQESTLCCRWRVFYVRELHLQGHAVGSRASPVKFDWLESTTKPSALARVKAALTINRGALGFANRIGGRETDPWVPVNRELVDLFKRLHPPRSEGRFFLRWGPSDGEGRLQFVEWFRALLALHSQHQIIIFDPYFESAGLGLLLLYAAPNADCIVFRSLPKPPREGDGALDKAESPVPSGIDNLLANCEHNRRLLSKMRLRIFGLKDGRLHDRYILIMGHDGLPIAGFNLSNSLQKIAENYPLLVTPIPADVLLTVERYLSGLMQEVAASSESDTDLPAFRLLFDSVTPAAPPQHYERLRFLDRAQAGDVLSVWTGMPSLRGLSGDRLKRQLTELDLLKDESLKLSGTAALRRCLDQQTSEFTEFSVAWEVLGEILAQSSAGDSPLREFESQCDVLKFLSRFLEASFDRAHSEVGAELAVVEADLFRKSIEDLLHSPYQPHHLFHLIKYSALTWPEFFAVKILWLYAPDLLLATAEAKMDDVPAEPQDKDAMRLSLLSQILSEISLSVQFGLSGGQRDRLLRSRSGVLKWMGLNAIERQLKRPGEFAVALQAMASLSQQERVRALGWMVQHAARNPNDIESYKNLIAVLNETLPAMISGDQLRHIVDSMRGHMRQITWAEPWLFEDVINPLLQTARADYDDACTIWIQEIIALLDPKQKHISRLFDLAREGRMTNVSAFLFAHSSPERQRASLKPLHGILRRQQRIILQPLASTSDWTRWNDALVVSMWVLIFTRWCIYYLRARGTSNLELNALSNSARELALRRPFHEWQPRGAGQLGEYVAFLDQVENLLASSDCAASESQEGSE